MKKWIPLGVLRCQLTRRIIKITSLQATAAWASVSSIYGLARFQSHPDPKRTKIAGVSRRKLSILFFYLAVPPQPSIRSIRSNWAQNVAQFLLFFQILLFLLIFFELYGLRSRTCRVSKKCFFPALFAYLPISIMTASHSVLFFLLHWYFIGGLRFHGDITTHLFHLFVGVDVPHLRHLWDQRQEMRLISNAYHERFAPVKSHAGRLRQIRYFVLLFSSPSILIFIVSLTPFVPLCRQRRIKDHRKRSAQQLHIQWQTPTPSRANS